jgi:hypothetical protein
MLNEFLCICPNFIGILFTQLDVCRNDLYDISGLFSFRLSCPRRNLNLSSILYFIKCTAGGSTESLVQFLMLCWMCMWRCSGTRTPRHEDGLRDRHPGFDPQQICVLTDSGALSASYPVAKLRGLSPRANYTDRAIAPYRRRWCLLLRIEGVTWSASRIPTAVFLAF